MTKTIKATELGLGLLTAKDARDICNYEISRKNINTNDLSASEQFSLNNILDKIRHDALLCRNHTEIDIYTDMKIRNILESLGYSLTCNHYLNVLNVCF